jgi:hypothetical protein
MYMLYSSVLQADRSNLQHIRQACASLHSAQVLGDMELGTRLLLNVLELDIGCQFDQC